MFSDLFGVQAKRKRMLAQTASGPLQDYYSTPFPEPVSSIRDVRFAVLDFETTGLEVSQAHLISLGLVEIENLGIRLASTWYEIIKTSRDLPENSTVIHQITDDMVRRGLDIKQTFERLLGRLKGHVLIAHHAKIELGFLKKVCRELYQQDFLIPVIDTQQLARRQLQRNQVAIKENTLRLFNLRDRYNLPSYKAHNALSDAMTTAELFLAVVADLYPNLDCKLRDLVMKK